MRTQLPNAPLIEVVFELRWNNPTPDTQRMPVDPGYPILLDLFEAYAKRNGFGETDQLSPGYGGFSNAVSRRFYRKANAYPLLQIGHGVMAVNASAEYEWNSFREMAVSAATFVVKNYPKLQHFDFAINRIEIRYVNGFEEQLVGAVDWLDFLNRSTTGNIEASGFLRNSRLGNQRRGRFFLETDTKRPSGSIFNIEIASAMRGDVPSVRMTNKVVKVGENVISSRQPAKFTKLLTSWLEAAHNITSSAFKEIITKETYEKFK